MRKLAFITSIDLNSGLNIKNSYVKIIKIDGGKEGATLFLEYYLNKEKADDPNFTPLKTETYNFTVSNKDDSDNWIKQGYIYLRALDKFSEAIDVLEPE